MHSVTLLANSLTEDETAPLPFEPVGGVCAVTGEFGACIPRKYAIKKTFTNLDVLAAPESQMVSVAAFQALAYKWQRMSCWICDGKSFRKLKRPEIREIVINADYPDKWCGYTTTSYKKHGVLWARVNTAGSAIWRFEMRDADCSDHNRLLSIWDRLNIEIRSGIPRPVLESLNPSPHLIGKIGYAKWIDFEKWALPIYNSGLYQFMCYLLPSKEELKNEA